jgi:hypothetical protein
MKTHKILLRVLLISIAFNSYSQNRFILDATFSGFADGAEMKVTQWNSLGMVMDMQNEKRMYLTENKLHWEADLSGPTLFSVRINTGKEQESVFFWAENKPMKLKGEKGKVVLSHVTGSVIQDQYEKYVLERFKENKKNEALKKAAKAAKSKKVIDTEKLIQNWDLNYVSQHPTEYCSSFTLAFLARYLPQVLPKDKAIKLYALLSDDLKSNVFGSQVKMYIDNAQ